MHVIAPNSATPTNLQRIKKAAKWYLCGSSPADNIKNWMLEGGAKGLVFGAIAGGVTGTVLSTPVGGVLGAVAGGVIDGTVGAASRVLWGSAASMACTLAGAY